MKLSSLLSPVRAASTLGVAVSLLSISGAQAALNVKISEMINFTTGNLGTVGAAEGWVGDSGNVTVTNGSGSLDGTSLGLLASQGDKAYVSATDALNTYCLFADANTFPTGTSNNIYYSFLYKFHNATFTNGVQRIIQANRQNAGSQFILQGVARTNNGQCQIGVVKNSGTISWSPTLINPGQTVFVVYRHQIIPPSTTADVCDLWVNPAPVAFGVAETNVPAPDASANTGTDDTSNTGPGRFYFASGADAEFDELRISTNWAEVTPPVNVCNGASISQHPSNTVVTADIRAAFSVVGAGTAPTYQWQRSTNGGSTFNNISGANGANYTTPPLATSDSGSQYRCVVHVVCNNSSATSGVATVTVNPFTVTPPGVLVDDVWADGNRRGLSGNNQVDPSNSVWFASSTATLDTSAGPLTATPVAGSSTLWVAYFTPTNNNTPVHLAVGSALKVTLPFVANDIPTNSGNSMRFGVFDYADGGLRITGDAFGSGSTGNGIGVLGYMLTQDWGTNFAANSPMGLSARTTLNDTNLMGSSGDFTTVGSGPGAPLFLTNAPAFSSGTPYTLEFTVARPTANSTVLTTSITGGGTNYTTTVTDTNLYYHRFDSFAIRPATLESTASSFTFPRFLVQVISVAVPFNITSITRPTANSAVITWDSAASRSYQVQSRDSLTTGNWNTNATVSAIGSSTSYTNSGISAINTRFYRVVDVTP